METTRLTIGNVGHYMGSDVIFKTRGNHIVKRIMGVSKSGKAIVVEHPDLHNRVNIATRNIYVILS